MRSSRLPRLDALRGLALVLMTIAHVLKSWARAQPELPAGARFFLGLEPAIPALFLAVSGFSAVLAEHRLRAARTPLRRRIERVLRRNGVLILLSWALFALDYGFGGAEMFLSPNILYPIGAAGLLISLLLAVASERAATRAIAALTVAGLGVTALLDARGLKVLGLNAGAGALVPFVAFAFFGACVALFSEKRAAIAGGAALALLAAGLCHGPWVGHNAVSYPERIDFFWNLRTGGALALLAPLGGLLLYASHGRASRASAVERPLGFLGRRTLAAYVAQLCMLRLQELAGFDPRTGVQAALALAAHLALACAVTGAALTLRSRAPAFSSSRGSLDPSR